jgi:hypothetical protein
MNILEFEKMSSYVREVLVHNKMVDRTVRDAAPYFINMWTAIRSPRQNYVDECWALQPNLRAMPSRKEQHSFNKKSPSK